VSRRFLLLLTLVACMVFAVPAWSQAPGYPVAQVAPWWWSGEHFLSAHEWYQAAYIAGVLDGLWTFARVATVEAEPWAVLAPELGMRSIAATTKKLLTVIGAVPDTANLDDVRTVVTIYLNRNPQLTNQNAALLVWRALAETEWE